MPICTLIFAFLLLLGNERAQAKAVVGLECEAGPAESSYQIKSIETIIDRLSGSSPNAGQNVKVAAVYGGHKRELMRPGHPWNSIGRLLLAGGDMCTATRISACHILSAAHCARFKSGKYRKVMAFQPPFEDQAYAVDKILAGEGDFNKEQSQDWAVMRLDDSASGKRDGWLGLADRKGAELVSKKFSLAGLQHDLSPSGKDLYLDKETEVIRTNREKDANPNHILYRASANSGSSGAVLFSLDENNLAWIAGIHGAGWVGEDGNIFLDSDETERLASGVASNEFFAKVQAFMAENPCKP